MLNMVGVGIILVGLMFAGCLTWRGRTTAGGFLAIVVAVVIASVAVANLPRVVGVAVQAGATTSIDLKLQEVQSAAQQVQTDTGEVRQMKEQIEVLLKRVEQGEQNVSQMHDLMQQTWRALFESSVYTIMTRNIFPIPAPVAQEVDRAINNLAAFAYPDMQERNAAYQAMMEKVKQAQGQLGNK